MAQLNALPAAAAAEGRLLETLIGGAMERGPLLRLAIALAAELSIRCPSGTRRRGRARNGDPAPHRRQHHRHVRL